MRHRGSVGLETFCFEWRIDKFLSQAGSKKWGLLIGICDYFQS